MTDRRQPITKQELPDPVVSFRNKPHLKHMMQKIEDKTGMSQSDIIRTCLVIQLPKMVKTYDANS